MFIFNQNTKYEKKMSCQISNEWYGILADTQPCDTYLCEELVI